MSGPKVRHGTQMKIYNQHLLNLKSISAKVDNKAPQLPVSAYINEASFYQDILRLNKIEEESRNLLKKINVIYRTKGRENCQLEKYERKKTKYQKEQAELHKVRKRNVEFLQTLDLKFVKSGYNQDGMLKHWKKALNIMKFSAKYPEYYEKQKSLSDSWSLCPKHVLSDPKTHQVCFLDLKIGDLPQTFRLEIQIYCDIVPGTAKNFTSLCRGFGSLTYKGSVFHRIVQGLLCIGGDIVNYTGTGGVSIYGPLFTDENFILQHNGPGVVAMYNQEPDDNSSQFLITFKKLSSLNGRYVVIGRVINNLKTLYLIESCGTKSGKPLDVVRVEDCGVYE